MKKILFLLLCTVVSYGQTYQNPTFGTVKTKTAPTVTTTQHLGTVETDGTISKITPENLPVSTATKDSINTKIASNAGLQNAYNFEPEIVTSAIKGAVTLKRGSAADTDNILVGQNGSGVTTSSVKGNGEIYTATPATATAFTHYFGQTESDGIIRPKTLANTQAEIVTTASVNAAKPNIVTGTGTTNNLPKFTGASTLGNSNLSDNGTIITSTTDMSVNGILVGRSSGTTTSNVRLSANGLSLNTTGVRNSSFGDGALQSNTTGSDNVGFSSNTLRHNTDGSNNIAIGSNAGTSSISAQNVTNISNSIFIGKDVKVLNASGDTNCIAIGGNSLGSNTSVIGNGSTSFGRWWGNLLVGTSTNNGNAGRFAGTVDVNKIQLNTTPATASGTPPLLTWNSTTKDVESVPYATFATTASPSFTGTPTAPTATAGTNTTQIATTAFVQSGFVPQIKITTTTSITTATLGSGLSQKGRNVVIDNGVNAINLTVDGTDGFCSSYLKHGTGDITFVQGSGRTLIQVDGTAVLSGAVGSTATISSVGTTDYLSISNK